MIIFVIIAMSVVDALIAATVKIVTTAKIARSALSVKNLTTS